MTNLCSFGILFEWSSERAITIADYLLIFRKLELWLVNRLACFEYLARLRWTDGLECPRYRSGGLGC